MTASSQQQQQQQQQQHHDYENIRAAVDKCGSDSRVEVNQRALIDKILARYASAGAVYRELIQNSNDAEATCAEILITTRKFNNEMDTKYNNANTTSKKKNKTTALAPVVTQVVYRNNGMPFRSQDWARLKKIAEGNPDVSKVGAFGVGAYTMFSICEEPLVISGKEALAFVWKGDSLFTRVAPHQNSNNTKETSSNWTTFVLPSRDPYPLPDMVEFGKFLCASMTFTQCLTSIKVVVDDKECLHISKQIIKPPTPATPVKASAFWKNDGAVTSSKGGIFKFSSNTSSSATDASAGNSSSIMESVQQVTVQLEGAPTSAVQARYVSGYAKTNISNEMATRMERVTKKKPPKQVHIQIFIGTATASETKLSNSNLKSSKRNSGGAHQITASFSPQMGKGRIFIGFRTSQTTGLAAHLAAPFLPTVEREAIDFQDPTLRVYNEELLEISGILMRLTLEHSMELVGVEWSATAQERTTRRQAWLLQQRGNNDPYNADTTRTQSLTSTTNNDTTKDNNDDNNDGSDDDEPSSASTSFMSFAKYMAKGVTKKIVGVLHTVDSALSNEYSNDMEEQRLLNPPDAFPLEPQERSSIVLMRSFLPLQSTPDPLVGTILAQGFGRCLSGQSPPCLTQSNSGVVRGNHAFLPYHGMEYFVTLAANHSESGTTVNVPTVNVVRKVVFENAKEYHQVIARCQPLRMEHVLAAMTTFAVWEETHIVRFLKWWTKFCRVVDPNTAKGPYGALFRNGIRFLPECKDQDQSDSSDSTSVLMVQELKDLVFYVDGSTARSLEDNKLLPVPTAVIPRSMQERIGLQTLRDASLKNWFSPLPFDIWAEFISQHRCMTHGQPEDEALRVMVLSTLSDEYKRRPLTERVLFVSFMHNLLSNKKCIPFDSEEPTQFAAECPSDLYLYSAELKAFDGVGHYFNKVSLSLKDAGVSDDFLVGLGVRKSVAIDFLFTNLDTLKWSDDPKPLIEYLRSAILTNQDLIKLKTTQYLPAENDISRTFAPSELFLPDSDLRVFPFLTMLQWPSDEVSVQSANGKFLQKLGIKVNPPLSSLLQYTASADLPDEWRIRGLDYVCKNLGPKGVYEHEYVASHLRPNNNNSVSLKFLPCVRIGDVLSSDEESKRVRELQSPTTCYSNSLCLSMGFPVLDPEVDKKSGKLYSSRFRCAEEPNPNVLISQLLMLVASCKASLKETSSNDTYNRGEGAEEQRKLLCVNVSTVFDRIFHYLSSRSNDFDRRAMDTFKKESFIPCRGANNSSIDWYKPMDVYFKSKANTEEDSLTGVLFHVIQFSPFLAAAGVKSEATTHDIFRLMVATPEKVLAALGSEAKYRILLRRIAADPPFRTVSPAIRNARFLIAYKIQEYNDEKNSSNDNDTKESASPVDVVPKAQLAAASDIFIIDNSFFGRMFPVLSAPHESDLEDFYARLGSKYISKGVKKNFNVLGGQLEGSSLTLQLTERINERRPLLVSPSVTSRPLLPKAGAILDGKNLSIVQVNNLKAVYSLGDSVRKQKVTCCAKVTSVARGQRNTLFVTEDFDWFDVGYAIGGLILQRCQLEDAFFIGSLLEAPLDQLRARGFPVDRILRPVMIETKLPPEPEPTITQIPTSPSASSVKVVNEKPQKQKNDDDGLDTALQQMFPDCSPEYIRARLGNNPSLEKLQEVANEMANGKYPKSSESSQMPPTPSGKEKQKIHPEKNANKGTRGSDSDSVASPVKQHDDHKRKFGKRLSRAFGGRKGHASPSSQKLPPVVRPPEVPVKLGPELGDELPKSPQADATNNASIEELLKRTVGNSSQVNPGGVNSPETHLTALPNGHERRDGGCEVIPAQHVQPFSGPYRNSKTHNGVRVFSSRRHPSSEIFLTDNFRAVDNFADILKRLCDVYSLDMSTICIFHDPNSSTIAFNSNRSLHFNVRFFYALHYNQNKQNSSECYSYWFTTMAHELAHHLASGHNKEHGFYTESYITLYLPKLTELLQQLGE